MDNPQSSKVFTEMGTEFYNNCKINILCYEELLSGLIESFNLIIATQNESKHCLNILKDCEACISQTFDIIIDLTEKSTNETKLGGLLGNAITILKMLASYLQNLVKSIPMTFCIMKSLPTTTGNLIYTVFKHCKNSECLYGIYLRGVENQLKDLFRTCHELQVIYLMIFEKYYVIDLDMKEEQEVLMASLDIYLKICDIVQGLDVKTMAEQWKAFTVICEKYATYLCNTHVFDKCIEHIVATVKTNMSLESLEEDKAVVRSLKVAGFVIKILSKLSNIFKNTSYSHEKIVQLFFFTLLYKNDLYPKKSPKHSNLIDNLILLPVNNLLRQLTNEEFLNFLTDMSVSKLQQYDMMSYILMLTTMMEHLTHNTNKLDATKEKLITCLFTTLPHCHILFITPSSLKVNSKETFCELYEYLLIHVAAFTTTFTSEEYMNLEKLIFEALLGTYYCTAFFASDLWVILCRNNNQLHLNTLTNLIRNYLKLETNRTFHTSPQRLYILHTIEKMFRTLPYDDKILIYRQFNVQDVKNYSVWCVMMTALPDNIRLIAENILTEQGLRYLKDFLALKNMRVRDLNSAIQHMKLISTCTSYKRDLRDIEEVLVNSWLKCCPNRELIQKGLSISSITYIQYVESITFWTRNFINKFQTSTSIAKIVHIVEKILRVGNIEMTLILFELYCELLWEKEDHDGIEEDYDVLVEVFLGIDKQDLEYLFAISMSNASLNNFMPQFLSKERMMKEVLNNFVIFKNNLSDVKSNQLESTFVHKCLNPFVVKTNEFKKNDNNINVANGDILLETEQPLSKKAKIDESATEDIIICMERNSSQLYQDRDMLSDDQKRRLRNVCDKLGGIFC